jgi:hypothetical protein
LGKQHHESEENCPRDQPPVLLRLAHQHVKDLDHECGQKQAEQETFEFIPQPRTKFLVREVVAVLEAETVILERSTDQFADQHQHHNV